MVYVIENICNYGENKQTPTLFHIWAYEFSAKAWIDSQVKAFRKNGYKVVDDPDANRRYMWTYSKKVERDGCYQQFGIREMDVN